MKRPTKHILIGLAAAAVVFVVICGILKATVSAATFNIVNPVWLGIVVVTWLAWSFGRQLPLGRRDT